MAAKYLRSLYTRTMRMAYDCAREEIAAALNNGGKVLECGCHDGQNFDRLQEKIILSRNDYYGIELDAASVVRAGNKGLNVIQADLNNLLPYQDNTFSCVIGLSVLEHLLYGCQWIRESYRILRPGGTLVILTPNISTFFSMWLLLIGKMPSSGPYPDSNILLKDQVGVRLSGDDTYNVETNKLTHRHLVVFSFRALKRYLQLLEFNEIRGYGFGLYPFPNFMQALLENLDPYHCHQMVFVAKKPLTIESH